MMTGFERYTKKTRRAMFLEEMEQVVPWAKLCGRQFAGIDLGAEPVPDETTVCKFRHLLEEHNLGEEILGTVNLHLQAKGVRITTGTIVDATLIHAPSSTKNREQSRDPEMHQARKGKQWYFGMKAHVGVDSKTKVIHTAVVTAANVSDVTMLPDLLHGDETRVWGDGAYQGQSEVIRECAPRAQDYTQRRCRYKGQIVDEVAWAKNRTKSKVRAKVEHVFQVMKLKFGFVKVRYRGLKKNAHRLFVTCALVNLFMSRRKLLAA
jgi:transposase, IS5 family